MHCTWYNYYSCAFSSVNPLSLSLSLPSTPHQVSLHHLISFHRAVPAISTSPTMYGEQGSLSIRSHRSRHCSLATLRQCQTPTTPVDCLLPDCSLFSFLIVPLFFCSLRSVTNIVPSHLVHCQVSSLLFLQPFQPLPCLAHCLNLAPSWARDLLAKPCLLSLVSCL